MVGLDAADQPFPEGEGLGVRIVDAEDAHALADPVLDHALQFLPQRLPVLALEIEGIDVLVFLRRILGVLDAAVRPVAEPLGMLLDVGVIRRALEGDVQRHFDAQLRELARPDGGKSSALPSSGWMSR